MGESLSQKLNVIGVVSLFGGDTALAALHYSSLCTSKLYAYAFVSPGLQSVAVKIFRRIDSKLARTVSPGNCDDELDILGLAQTYNFKYSGLHSGTDMTVRSALGEALLRMNFKGDFGQPLSPNRNVKRNIRLTIIRLGKLENIPAVSKLSVPATGLGYYHLIVPLLTIGTAVCVAVFGDYVTFSIVLLNVAANLYAVFTTKAGGIDRPQGNASDYSPDGDILVEDIKSAGNLWLVLGKENAIQYVFQRQVIANPWPQQNFFAACLSLFASIANVITIPFAIWWGQICFGGLLLIGLAQNIMLSALDGDELLCNISKNIVPVNNTSRHIFDNRSMAIAYCCKLCTSKNNIILENISPKSETWRNWCETLAGQNVINENLLLDIKKDIVHAKDVLGIT